MKSSSTPVKKILVVEDEPAICKVCVRALTPEGYQVDIASNGVIAEEMLAERDYDLLLIDIRTPVMNGRQLYQYVRDRHPKLTNRIVFTTGDVISDDIRHFLEQTSSSFLLKPFTPDALKAIVGETLSRLR